jgi:hypothetical protein
MPVSGERPGHGARQGDWIEVTGLPGRPARRGKVVEVMGAGDHERYRVRWDERHESVFFPTDSVHVVRAEPEGA